MDLILFVIFLSLSIILIALGLFAREHTELSIVGFVFLFLLAMILINQTLVYKIGTDTNSTVTGNLTTETTRDIYVPITADSSTAHHFGYYLAVASIIGFVGGLIGLKRSRGN